MVTALPTGGASIAVGCTPAAFYGVLPRTHDDKNRQTQTYGTTRKRDGQPKLSAPSQKFYMVHFLVHHTPPNGSGGFDYPLK